MDFFEALRTRAFEDAEDFVLHELDCKHTPTGAEFASMGIDSTIEALKEMEIGWRKRARLSQHTKPDGEQWTLARCVDGEGITLDGHHGIDGEEVVVMVFRDGKA